MYRYVYILGGNPFAKSMAFFTTGFLSISVYFRLSLPCYFGMSLIVMHVPIFDFERVFLFSTATSKSGLHVSCSTDVFLATIPDIRSQTTTPVPEVHVGFRHSPMVSIIPTSSFADNATPHRMPAPQNHEPTPTHEARHKGTARTKTRGNTRAEEGRHHQ